MSMFKLMPSRDVTVDNFHQYNCGNLVVTDTVTRIVGGNIDNSNINVIEAAKLGTKVHSAIEYIISGDEVGTYNENIRLTAFYMVTKATNELHKILGKPFQLKNAKPILFEWEGHLIGGTPDVIVGDVVVEFKTSSKASKVHQKQVLCYMEALNMGKGLIVYADPAIPCVVLVRGTKVYNSIKRSVQKDLNKYFEPPVMAKGDIVEDCDNTIVNLENIVSEIKELKKKLTELEAEKASYLYALLSNPDFSAALDSGKDIIVGTVSVSKVFVNRKKVNYDRMISEGVHDKYVEIDTSSYVKCVERF